MQKEINGKEKNMVRGKNQDKLKSKSKQSKSNSTTENFETTI
jgi:hypothetical protein